MRYLKKYNENNSNELEGLSDFVDEYLVELIDAGFDTELEYGNGYPGNVWIHLTKSNIEDTVFRTKRNQFYWDNIKNDFIPFLEMLNSKFNIYHIKFGIISRDNDDDNFYGAARYNTIVNGDYDNNDLKLFEIVIHIKF